MIDFAFWHGVVFQDYAIHWIVVGGFYFLGGLGAAIVSKTDWPYQYPPWFYTPSIVVSGGILIRVGAGQYYGPPVTMYADIILLIAALLLFGVFFAVAHTYAKNRDVIDTALSDVRNKDD